MGSVAGDFVSCDVSEEVSVFRSCRCLKRAQALRRAAKGNWMKTREEVVALFLNKYAYLKTVYPSVEAFNEFAVKQNPDGGWQLNLSPFAAITLRSCDEEPHETHGAICDRWRIEGESAGKMGYPISDEQNQNVTMPNPSISSSQNGCPSEISVPGAFSDFEFGRIEWQAENTDYGIQPGVTVKMKENSQRQIQAESAGQPELTLSDKTKNLLKRLDPIILELKNLCDKIKELCSKDECGDLQDGVKDILRRRRAFDSKTFFMVTFGMLKAGKSTLVNTFVGKIVSPVGRAKETTLRSSIIMASDQDNKAGIYLYSPTVNAQSSENDKVIEWQKDNGIRLMDFLTGLTTKEEFMQSFKEDYIPFSEPVLERLLTIAMVPEYPNILPPVIRVDASGANKEVGAANLLKDGVAILDTPGLDGSKANKDSDPFFTSLMSYGDYFLLVQSSMSAINKDCQELIAHLYHETKNAPLLVVFNEIASNFWLKPEVEKEKLREDSETASQELAKQLRNELGGIVPDIISINAGEASDAVFGEKNDNRKERDGMIEESRIRSLRDRIVKTLREKRTAIKERNATDRMLKALEDTINKIDIIIKNIKSKEEKVTKEEGERWEKQNAAAASLINAFKQTGTNIGVGIEIAQRFAKTMKWHMADEYKADGFKVDNNPYLECTVKGNVEKPTHDHKSASEAREKQQKAIDGVAKRFTDRFRESFYNDDLCVSHEPWKDEWKKTEEELKKMMALVNEICVSSGNESDKVGAEFITKMFQSLGVTEILSNIGGALRPEPIAPIPKWKFNFNKDVVYECECYKAYERLSESITQYFPDEAAKTVADRFKDAIIKRGLDCARHLDAQTQERILCEKDAAKARKMEVGNRLNDFTKAKQMLEEMKSIMREA